ncbi:MAG TPA: hypothetical protein VF956_00270 [Candidatus Dormibacteraeota bacterium]
MSIDASPPAQPPQMSPDGNWVWDGAQWQPVTGVEPTHEGVFAAYAQKVEAAEQTVAAAPPVAVAAPVRAAAPAVDYGYAAPAVDYGYPAPEQALPLWQQPKSSRKTAYLYGGGAVVLFVMVLIVLNSINFLSLPFIGGGTSSNPTPAAGPSPTAAPVRSEYGRADVLVKGSLTPAIASLEDTKAAMESCTAELSNICFNAITASDEALKNVLAVIDHGSIPSCIAAPMKQLRNDFAQMDSGLQLGLKGFKDNQTTEVVNGVHQFRSVAQSQQGDTNAVVNAQSRCSHDLEGP